MLTKNQYYEFPLHSVDKFIHVLTPDGKIPEIPATLVRYTHLFYNETLRQWDISDTSTITGDDFVFLMASY